MQFAVVSTGRAHAVANYPGFTFYVPPQEADEYREAGAVVRTAIGLSGARNLAMDDAFAFDEPVAILSDDLQALTSPYAPAEDDRADLPERIKATAEAMHEAIEMTRIYLAGVPSHSNKFWARGGTGLSTHTWVDGDFQVIRPNPLRYDETLPLHETLDFALDHLHTFGQVARFDRVLAKFQHRTNPGGCQAIRREHPELEPECEARMRAKWSCCLSYTEGTYEAGRAASPMPVVKFRKVHG